MPKPGTSPIDDLNASTFTSMTDRLVWAGARMLARTMPVTTEQAAIDKALGYLTDPAFQPRHAITAYDAAEDYRVRAIYAAAVLAVWNEDHGT